MVGVMEVVRPVVQRAVPQAVPAPATYSEWRRGPPTVLLGHMIAGWAGSGSTLRFRALPAMVCRLVVRGWLGQSSCRCLSEMAELTATAAVVAKATMVTTTAPVGFEWTATRRPTR